MQVEAGARIVQIFDSWGGELSPRDFEAFSLPYLTRMVHALQAKGVPVIVFGTAMSTHLPLLRKTGADVLGCDWRIELDQARALAGPDVALQGNLDPLALFLPAAELDQRVADILRRAGPVGHIFNLGHGILPPTSPDAAKHLVETVHRLGCHVTPPPTP
jgi:uroporphyrinogen decarboxylase